MTKTILIVGTYDTKDAELRFLEGVINDQGGGVLTMDVSVLKDPVQATDFSKHDVAKAGDSSIEAAIAYDDEQGKFFLGHGGKSNLVRLNGMPVLSTEEMNSGDEIRIGETTLKFVALCGEAFTWAAAGETAAE